MKLEIEEEIEEGQFLAHIVSGEVIIGGDIIFSAEKDGIIRKVTLESDIVFHNFVAGETFEEALESSRDLQRILKDLIEAKKTGFISETSWDSSPSLIRYKVDLELKSPVERKKGFERALLKSIRESVRALPKSVQNNFDLGQKNMG